MNWIWRAVKALWGRMMVRVDNLRLAGLERKQQAARGVVGLKHPNNGRPLHVRSGKK